ncbi:MAG: hypothetical protein SO287_00365 [Parabacteroides sp.]|nr:hypothetical protein [Parabacteroides sp.]
MTKRLYCICCSVLCLLLFLSCHHDGEQIKLEEAVNYCWEYAQHHPNGFTLDISDYSVPKEGIVVAYMETQDSFGRIESGRTSFVGAQSDCGRLV